ncbi:MAG: MFS transporter [Aureliella sp.]|jgi:acyl-[acyl-carrier-protein]-phospholipid O-acyltransferase/long-chain-fatty-acid--[acyl-carrier-protein] ligase
MTAVECGIENGLASEQSDHAELPPLLADRSFWGLAVTQFLGAFNDNLYKQLILLLAVPAVAGAAALAGQPEAAADAAAPPSDVQGWALFVFSIPFVLFSGFAGFLSDRFSKQPIILLCKIAEIGVTSLALIAFLAYDSLHMVGTWTVLFLMGTHSAFFGPGKYGILPEIFRARDLARANGIILMSTFLAIIFGTVAAGALHDHLIGDSGTAHNLWIASLVCIGIAVAGTISATLIRRTPPAEPNLPLTSDAWSVSHEVRHALASDRPLLIALLASCVFWLVAGIAMPAINSLGVTQLGLDKTSTSLLTASIAVGIMVGAVLAGTISRFGKTDRLVTIGLWGILASLVALGMWHGESTHVLGQAGSIVALMALGIFAAIYSVPLQVFLQQRPPSAIKGRMIATMNQANFIGILLAGPLYQLFERIAAWTDSPISSVFWMIGLLVLPLAIFYRLDSEA